jgi:hypothetical protein
VRELNNKSRLLVDTSLNNTNEAALMERSFNKQLKPSQVTAAAERESQESRMMEEEYMVGDET